MSMTPAPNRKTPSEETTSADPQTDTILPQADSPFKQKPYKIPPRPQHWSHSSKMEEIPPITTMSTSVHVPIPRRPPRAERLLPMSTSEGASVASTVSTHEHLKQTSSSLPAKQKKGLSKRLMLLLRIGITLLLVVLILRGVSWSDILSIYRHVDLAALLLGLTMGTLGVIFSAYLWHRLVQAENIRADLSHLTSLYLIGVAFSNFLPTSMGGDALKAYYVGRDSGNMAGSTSAILMSRITGFFGMLLVALPVLLFLHASFNGILVQRFLLLCLLFLVGFGAAFIMGAFLPKIQGTYLKGTWANNKLLIKVFETGIALTASLKKPRSLIEAVTFGFLFWLANCLNYYIYAAALGVQTPFRFYLLAVPFIGVVGALPISISGYGVREGLVEYLYSTIHVSTSTALAVVLLMDIQRLLFSLIGGLLFLLMENGLKSEKRASVS